MPVILATQEVVRQIVRGTQGFVFAKQVVLYHLSYTSVYFALVILVMAVLETICLGWV
jgi:hypothetical protein